MDKQSKKILGLFARYIAVLLIGLGNLYVVYKVLTPLTIYVLNAILSIFTETVLKGNMIETYRFLIEIVPACVAGSAFYLLLLLIMLTADIKPEVRTKAIISAFGMLFALNMLRILILVPIVTTPYFETAHWIFWHLISTIFVVGVWFIIIKLYKIKAIPIYSDFKYLKSLIKFKKSKSVKSKKSKGKKKNK